MSSRAFRWDGWQSGDLPVLQEHSRTKLAILSDYIQEYITIRCQKNPRRRERFRLLLVDGFAGGGIYAGGEPGSPLVILEAVRAAQAKLAADGRTKPLHLDVHYFFVERHPDSFACLEAELRRSEFASLLGKEIHLHHGTFRTAVPSILTFADQFFPRGGVNAIFLLDQCGYTDVDAPLVRDIYERLHGRPEFIINFAIDHLLNFAADNAEFRKIVPQMGLGARLTADELIRARAEADDSWRFAIESRVGTAYREVVGCPVFSPFFIESPLSRRGYWLLHLAPHHRARSAMLDVQWRHATDLRHYGNSGLHMLQFRTDRDRGSYLASMDLGSATRDRALGYLSADFPRQIRDRHEQGLRVDDLQRLYANDTVANVSLINEALIQARDRGEILITGPGGARKRSGGLFAADLIRPERQILLLPTR